MRGRPHLFTSYEAEESILPTWTQRVMLALFLILVITIPFELVPGLHPRRLQLSEQRQRAVRGESRRHVRIGHRQVARGEGFLHQAPIRVGYYSRRSRLLQRPWSGSFGASVTRCREIE